MSERPLGLSHAVYFTLKTPTPENRAALIASCRKYLSGQPGLVHFSAGERGTNYQRPVNDQQFDVALTVVFATEADHDAYQQSPDHLQFIAENSPTWAQVRVFDALVEV